MKLPGLAAVQLIVLLTDDDVKSGVGQLLTTRYERAGIRHQLYSDSAFPDRGVLGCCGTTPQPLDPEHRLERLLPDVFARAPTHVDWFIFTHGDTWWHLPNLEAEVRRIDAEVAPATAEKDYLVAGGGGYLVFTFALMLSRPALAHLADKATLDGCRAALLSCTPYAHATPSEFAQLRAAGCHSVGPGTGRRDPTAYAAKDLINYCAAAPLAAGRCGPRGVGCEWRFGGLARDSERERPEVLFARFKAGGSPMPNEMARRRFRQNPTGGALRLSARERDPGCGGDDACCRVVCDLVALEHAGNATWRWLDAAVATQRATGCCAAARPGGVGEREHNDQ